MAPRFSRNPAIARIAVPIAVAPCLLVLGLMLGAPATPGATLTSSDGRTAEFEVLVSAAPKGLTVKRTKASPAVLIPWARLDAASLEKSVRLSMARSRALSGQTVALEGRPDSLSASVSHGGVEFGVLADSGVASPEVLFVWLGSESPLPLLWWDLARKREAAFLTVAPGKSPATPGVIKGGLNALATRAKVPSLAEAPLILIGLQDRAPDVWRLVNTKFAERIMAACTIRCPAYKEEPTGYGFGMPLLMIDENPESGLDRSAQADLTVGLNLWHKYTTSGCRWCWAGADRNAGRNLGLVECFVENITSLSNYVEIAREERAIRNHPLGHRIPGIIKNPAKDLDESGAKLGDPASGIVTPLGKRPTNRRDGRVWLPNADFADGWTEFIRQLHPLPGPTGGGTREGRKRESSSDHCLTAFSPGADDWTKIPTRWDFEQGPNNARLCRTIR